jgi:KaiC/GvpD/RAD55 family RecA-like ATPase
MAAEWLKQGGKVDYWIAAQPPEKMRQQLRRLGISNVEELENSGQLEIWDCYTCQLGRKSTEKLALESLRVADLSIWWSKMQALPGRPPDSTMLRVFDDLTILGRFNDEKSWVEIVLTRLVPVSFTRKETGIRGLMKGTGEDWLYKRLEGAFDGIVDFNVDESSKEPRNLIRIRSMRTVPYNPEWHTAKIHPNFQVTIEK